MIAKHQIVSVNTFSQLHGSGLASSSALQSFKCRQHNDGIVVQVQQGGLVLPPVAEYT